MAIRVLTTLVVGAVTLAATGGCGEKQPPAPAATRELEVWKSDTPPEPELTIEEQRAKLEADRENQPEPKLDPNDPREKHELVWKEGKATLKSIYGERENVITQTKDVPFDDKLEEQKKKLKALIDKVEGFSIGMTPADLETGASRFCALVDELRTGADALGAEGEAKLKEIDAVLADLEAKQKEGAKITTRQFEKQEAERKMWSSPVLGARYIYMAMRTLYDEAFVLADLGARRSQIVLRDCLGKADIKPLAQYPLADEARLKVVKRAKYYVP